VSAVAEVFVGTASGLAVVVPQRNQDNTPGHDLPPVLPYQLVELRMPQFSTILAEHANRLAHKMDTSAIHAVRQKIGDLPRLHKKNNSTRGQLDKMRDSAAFFDSAWSDFAELFPRLQQFCGDLASAFVGWEKDECRQSLTDLSLEGILHAKQHSGLK
jgi:hypothetical protein